MLRKTAPLVVVLVVVAGVVARAADEALDKAKAAALTWMAKGQGGATDEALALTSVPFAFARVRAAKPTMTMVLATADEVRDFLEKIVNPEKAKWTKSVVSAEAFPAESAKVHDFLVKALPAGGTKVVLKTDQIDDLLEVYVTAEGKVAAVIEND